MNKRPLAVTLISIALIIGALVGMSAGMGLYFYLGFTLVILAVFVLNIFYLILAVFILKGNRLARDLYLITVPVFFVLAFLMAGEFPAFSAKDVFQLGLWIVSLVFLTRSPAQEFFWKLEPVKKSSIKAKKIETAERWVGNFWIIVALIICFFVVAFVISIVWQFLSP